MKYELKQWEAISYLSDWQAWNQLIDIGEGWGRGTLLLALGSTNWCNRFGDEFGYISKVDNVYIVWPPPMTLSGICCRRTHGACVTWPHSVCNSNSGDYLIGPSKGARHLLYSHCQKLFSTKTNELDLWVPRCLGLMNNVECEKPSWGSMGAAWCRWLSV